VNENDLVVCPIFPLSHNIHNLLGSTPIIGLSPFSTSKYFVPFTGVTHLTPVAPSATVPISSYENFSPTTAPRLNLHHDLNAGISGSTSVLNHNTLPTIHNNELIRLSMRWFQRKQSRSKGSVLLRK
jgi:hypothetical protein